MLEATGVFPIPGSTYGQKQGTHHVRLGYLTIVPQALVGYEMIRLELTIIMSYPTSPSRIIALLKTIKKYC